MRAIVCDQYGEPEVLQMTEVAKPVPGEGEVLVRIHAASLNAADLETLRGDAIVRIGGPFRPMYKIPGSDIAGVVEAIGPGVTRYQPGDEVFADLSSCGFGAFAEFTCAPQDKLDPKPACMSFEEAAAYPQAAVIALQGLLKPPLGSGSAPDLERLEGQEVLINGAGGGMGTFAVQIAKHFGATVTGVDRAEKFETLRSLGADKLIDYREDDYTSSGQQYDLILDVVANRSIFAYRDALRPGGKFIMVGGPLGTMLQALVLGPMISRRSDKLMGINSWNMDKGEDIALLEALFEAGKVVPVIDRTFPLAQVPEAYRYMIDKPFVGKILINVNPGEIN